MTWRDGPAIADEPWRGGPRALRNAAARRPRAPSRAALAVRVDPEAAFAFGLFIVMLFALQLGSTLGAALQAAIISGYGLLQRKRLWEVLAPRAFLLAVPLLAVVSVLWSEAPRESLKFALELLLTVFAALLLAGAERPRVVLRAIFAAFLVYVVVAIIFGHATVVGNGGGRAFSGLSDGKNLLADIAASGVLISLGVLVMSVQRHRLGWLLVSAAAVLIELYAVMAARSAGAILGLAFGLIAMAGLVGVSRMGLAVRAILIGFLAVCLLLGGLTYRWLAGQLIQIGADLFDKDYTLTGRTYLWYRADELIHEKPLLGRGFHAFWLQGNMDAEGLWRYAGITGRGGFSFHNTLVELLVQLGWTGVVVVGLVVLIAIARLVDRWVREPTLSLCIWTSLLFYELVRTPIEVVGIAGFYFPTVLTFTALAIAFVRAPAKAFVRAPRAARVMSARAMPSRAVYEPRRLLTPPPASEP